MFVCKRVFVQKCLRVKWFVCESISFFFKKSAKAFVMFFLLNHLLLSHCHIFTSSHLHLLTSSHLQVLTSSFLHITHLHIFTDLHIFINIFLFCALYLYIFFETSSYMSLPVTRYTFLRSRAIRRLDFFHITLHYIRLSFII